MSTVDKRDKKNLKIVELLYKDIKTCDVKIQNVPFHSFVLIHDYFKAQLEFNKISGKSNHTDNLDYKDSIDSSNHTDKLEEIKLPNEFSENCIEELKRWCYNQPIGELTAQLYVEIYHLSRILLLNMYIDYRDEIDNLLKKINHKDLVYVIKNIPGIVISDTLNIVDVNILNSNIPEELNLIAYCYRCGIGCVKDEKKAFDLFKLNWEKNKNANSLNHLAMCYRYGFGCVEDAGLAFKLRKLNWEENKNSVSLHNLAIYYECGRGCIKDKKKAFELYKLNWEENRYISSLKYLIECYEKGIGCEKNISEAKVLSDIL